MATKKAAKASRPRARRPADRNTRLAVRMYRGGLGDCFLLRFPGAKGGPFFMLIDCGLILGTKDPQDIVTRILKDVIAVTNGRVHVLVATHEHWDHVSGFVQGRELIARGDESGSSARGKLRVDTTWFAWTEDPENDLARKLRKERRDTESALRLAEARLRMVGMDEAETVGSLLSFFGASGANSTSEAMKNAGAFSRRKPRYCQPSDPPITLEDLPGIRFWVLGPPEDEKLIKRTNPRKGEAYGLDEGMGVAESGLIASIERGLGFGATRKDEQDLAASPFDDIYTIPEVRAKQIAFFRRHYYEECADAAFTDQSWRRIDDQWMGASETLALQLDSATNNTSLVLAIEFEGGDVFLFPGDAQAGSWLSWQDLKWAVKNAAGEKVEVTGPDLLKRTVFYKVGHHGSHNATLSAKGLELMTRRDLVAMIPVDHEMAKKKHWNHMPLEALVEALESKTKGRVLRIDDKEPLNTRTPPKGIPEAEWRSFLDRAEETELYYEVRF